MVMSEISDRGRFEEWFSASEAARCPACGEEGQLARDPGDQCGACLAPLLYTVVPPPSAAARLA
jgi:hypothetical protein